MKSNVSNTSDIRKDIIEIVSRITMVDQSGISDDVLIQEELGIDSLMAIEIVATIEKFFTVVIDETLLNKVKTVGEFIQLIQSIVQDESH